MIFKSDSMKNISRHLSYKLCTLLSSLNDTTYEYEQVAENIDNKEAKLTLRSIATETNQYAAELSAQLKCFNVPFLSGIRAFSNKEVSAYMHALSDGYTQTSLSAMYNENEHSLLAAYKSILEEAVPFPFVKQMIARQCEGIKRAFMKARLSDLIQPNRQKEIAPDAVTLG